MIDEPLEPDDDVTVRDVRVPDADASRPIEWWRDMVAYLRGKVDALRESDAVKGLPGALSALDTAESALNRRERQYQSDHPPQVEAEDDAAGLSPAQHEFWRTVRPLIVSYADDAEIIEFAEARAATERALAGLPPPGDADTRAVLRRWIESLDDETLAERQALADEAERMYRDVLDAELERRAYESPYRRDAVDDAPEPAQTAPEPIDTPPAPPRAVQRRSGRAEPMVIDLHPRDPDHDRGWQRVYESDAPR